MDFQVATTHLQSAAEALDSVGSMAESVLAIAGLLMLLASLKKSQMWNLMRCTEFYS